MGFQHLYPEKLKLQREATFQHFQKAGKSLSNAELELACFRSLPIGHKLKGEFCISLALMRWPFLYVEKDGIENYWFTRMCRVLCTHKRVYMIGSASSGKTTGMSVVGMNLWGSSPWDSTFLVTSTDKEGLDARIWGSIRDLHEKDKFGIGVRIDYEDAIVLEKNAKKRDIRDAVKAIALPKGSEGEKAIGKVQGRKNTNIIWACDEYDHMDPFVKAAKGNLSSAPTFLFWAASNQPREGSPMHIDCAPNPEKYPMGWDTPGLSDLEMWETKDGGVCLYFDGEKSPNTLATGDKDPFPMLTRRDYIEGVRAEVGEEGLDWWKYIKAFPKVGQAHDKLIDSKFVERYRANEDAVWMSPEWTVVAGLDAAWTRGGDACMADFGKVGVNDEGLKVLQHEADAVKINPKGKTGTYEEQLASAFLDECQNRNCHSVAIDISGSGGRVANPIISEAHRRNYKLNVISVDSAGAPDEAEMYHVGSIQKNGKQLFKRRVDEVWVSYRMAIQNGLIRGIKLTSKAFREMADRRIDTDEDRRFVLESKDEFKKRNAGKSPDSGESRVLCQIAARKAGLGADLAKRLKQSEAQKAKSPLPTERKGAYAWTSTPKKAGYSW